MPQNNKNIRAIILAAGESKRLMSLTINMPKCLLKVNDLPIINHQINALIGQGINRVSIVVGYKKEVLKKHLLESVSGVIFDFIENEKYTETSAAYSLWLTKHHLINEDVIYLNSDAVFDPKILSMILNDQRPSLTAIKKNDWNEEQVNVIIDSNYKVLEIGKHITEKANHGEFIGVTKLGKDFNESLTKALEWFILHGELKKFAADGINIAIKRFDAEIYAFDIGTLNAIEVDTSEDYDEAKRLWSV